MSLIWGYTLLDRISNSDLFKCSIEGRVTFHVQSKLRWVGPVIQMEDDRIFINCQVYDENKYLKTTSQVLGQAEKNIV